VCRLIEGLFIKQTKDGPDCKQTRVAIKCSASIRGVSGDHEVRAPAKTFENECFDMDERQVLVYIRSVQDRFQSDGVKRSL
jgi:hypothetical protein